MLKVHKYCLITALAIMLIAATPAQANAGIPMLLLVWPAMWLLLLPIIVLEAAVATKILHIDFMQGVQIAGVANLVSTLVGIPITWFLLFIVQLKAASKKGDFGLDTLRGKILSVTLQSSWLIPYENANWMVPAAELFLCIPFFLMSVSTEFFCAVCFTQNKLPTQNLLAWAWMANGISYGIISLVCLAILVRTIYKKEDKQKLKGNERESLLSMLNQKSMLLADVALSGLAAVAFYIAEFGKQPPDYREYLDSLKPGDPVSVDVLKGLLESKNTTMMRKWLILIREHPVATDYYFSSPNTPLIDADSLAEDIRTTIRQTINPQVILELVRALKGRRDDETTHLLIELLTHSDGSIRYWSGDALVGNTSSKLAVLLPGLIRNGELRTTALTECAIANNINGLHDVYDVFMESDNAPQDWKLSASEYLSAFPRKQDVQTFTSILERKGDAHIRWNAAMGLGEMGDPSSIDLIIAAMNRESHDSHKRAYLKALAKIKGDRAKKTVTLYKNSKDSYTRKLVARLLKNW
jgi:HEAT repeat protein